jgi:anti-sigma-K factor RskA
MTDERDLQLLRYLSGEADPVEAADLEARLAAEPELALELRSWQETLAAVVSDGAEPVEPSAELRQSLFDTVAKSEDARSTTTTPTPAHQQSADTITRFPQPQRSFGLPGWLAAAACLLAAFGLARGFQVERQLRNQVADMTAQRQQLEDRLSALGNRLTGTEGDVEQLALVLQTSSSPRTRTVIMAGLEDAPGAFGTTLVRPGEAAFFAYALPQLSERQDYQLWFIGEQGPVSAGTFEVDQAGNARVVVAAEDLERAGQWAVTIEPQGGVPQPTGTMVLLGSVSA